MQSIVFYCICHIKTCIIVAMTPTGKHFLKLFIFTYMSSEFEHFILFSYSYYHYSYFFLESFILYVPFF